MTTANQFTTTKKTGSLFVIAVIAVFAFLWIRTSHLNTQVQTLQNQQTAKLEKQVRLQANADFLTSKQIDKLTDDAFSGSVASMDCLYTYYKGKGSTPSAHEDNVNAFVWGSLLYKFQKDLKSADRLDKHYQRILSGQELQSAKKKIAFIQNEIDKNIASVNKGVKQAAQLLKSPMTEPVKVVVKSAISTAESELSSNKARISRDHLGVA